MIGSAYYIRRPESSRPEYFHANHGAFQNRAPAQRGGAFATYKRFAAGKTSAEAEFTAQPLAALSPYGCGVPLAGASAEHLKFPRNPKKKHLQSRCFFFVLSAKYRCRTRPGPRTAGRRVCAVRVFWPQAKTSAQAEFTAQPLAALSPYGCGVPLAGASAEHFKIPRYPKRNTSLSAGVSFWRRHPDLNRGMRVLQTLALPLGYVAMLYSMLPVIQYSTTF